MRGMSSLFDFEVVVKNNCSATNYFSGGNCDLGANTFCEPISVLDYRIPSGPTSSSALSSSLGGGGGGAASSDTVGVAAVSDRNSSPKWQQDSTTATSSSAGGVDSELFPVLPSLAAAGVGGEGSANKCAMEDWECMLSESGAVSPGQEQSIFRWIMGDVEDPVINGSLNKFLQSSGGGEFDFGGGFGVVDQAFTGENLGANFISSFSNNNRSSNEKINSSNPVKFHQNPQNPMSVAANFHHQSAFDSTAELKPLILNPQLLLQQQQAQCFLLPFSWAEEQEHTAAAPPPAKRLNSGVVIPNARQQGMFTSRQQLNPQHRPRTSGGDELQQWIIDHLHKAAELLQTGNPPLAQGILARLNHQLSPIGNSFQRAAFYFKEALQQLLHSSTTTDSFPLSLVLKIGAYKSFSEVSPIIDFTNFTCNQALLEALEGFDHIHIVDFDIGFGGQWASLMQELALRCGGGAPMLRITAVVSPTTHHQLELSLTRENLIQFANEINIGFELDFMSTDSLRSLPHLLHQEEAVAVILPTGSLSKYQLGLVKQLSPRVVVSVERGCDRADLPFPNHISHALCSYSSLLESLDTANVNAEAQQKIERFFIQPGIEKMVQRRFGGPQQQHWRSLFASCGFSPVVFSNSTELQAECVVKRSGVAGFEVEKRQSSLVLWWQRKEELLSASLWR